MPVKREKDGKFASKSKAVKKKKAPVKKKEPAIQIVVEHKKSVPVKREVSFGGQRLVSRLVLDKSTGISAVGRVGRLVGLIYSDEVPVKAVIDFDGEIQKVSVSDVAYV